ncbi:MAG: hypothetical protein Q4F05_16915 [bacterium]|nr:hypothetical protein [bacterium]
MKKIWIMIFAALLLFMVSVPLVNNYSARKVATELKELPLPENTTYIEHISKAGKLCGNGNGMQYLGGILIKSELSLEELDTYYSKYNKEYVVEKQFAQKIGFVEHTELAFETELSGTGYYFIYLWGEGIEPFSYIDIRGH